MTGHDWVAVLALFGLLVACISLDVLTRRERDRLTRAENDERHRRLMGEIRRLP